MGVWFTKDCGEDTENEREEEELVELDPFRNTCLQGSHASEGIGMAPSHLW